MAGQTGFFLVEDTLSLALEDVGPKLMGEVEAHALKMAEEILDYAKTNAPWEDRTGAARAGLDVAVQQDVEAIIIQLYHTVDYGLWLEVIQNGRFAIIMPTLERFAGPVMGSLSEGQDTTGGEESSPAPDSSDSGGE
jgi:hypothetical protein